MAEISKTAPVYLGLFTFFTLYLTEVSVTEVHIALKGIMIS
jgi:hypothetical protein